MSGVKQLVGQDIRPGILCWYMGKGRSRHWRAEIGIGRLARIRRRSGKWEKWAKMKTWNTPEIVRFGEMEVMKLNICVCSLKRSLCQRIMGSGILKGIDGMLWSVDQNWPWSKEAFSEEGVDSKDCPLFIENLEGINSASENVWEME